MNKKILITYATKYGATKEIADKSAEVLRQADLQADILLVANVHDITALIRRRRMLAPVGKPAHSR